MTLISVEKAIAKVKATAHSFGTEIIPIDSSVGRILAENVHADRDMPPYDRVTMDGIGIRYDAYAKGQLAFESEGISAAGDPKKTLSNQSNCMEVMTGGIVPMGIDTIIRIEDVMISDDTFQIKAKTINQGQNIHTKGSDVKSGALLMEIGKEINSSDVNVLASVGKPQIMVKALPTVAIVSTGNELVDVNQTPEDHQIRRSNNYMIGSRLSKIGAKYSYYHFTDNEDVIRKGLQQCLVEHDVVLLSGGVSKGKFDYLPQILDELEVECIFHGVAQRPGKPFWFGKNEKCTVFAFPGNPVSTLACLNRYFVTWLQECDCYNYHPMEVILANDVTFSPMLTYFAQARLSMTKGKLLAHVHHGRGSGDIVSPLSMDGFIEFPSEKDSFKTGEVFNFFPI